MCLELSRTPGRQRPRASTESSRSCVGAPAGARGAGSDRGAQSWLSPEESLESVDTVKGTLSAKGIATASLGLINRVLIHKG